QPANKRMFWSPSVVEISRGRASDLNISRGLDLRAWPDRLDRDCRRQGRPAGPGRALPAARAGRGEKSAALAGARGLVTPGRIGDPGCGSPDPPLWPGEETGHADGAG